MISPDESLQTSSRSHIQDFWKFNWSSPSWFVVFVTTVTPSLNDSDKLCRGAEVRGHERPPSFISRNEGKT